MPGTALLLGFVAAALVVLLTPGPGVLYVVSRSLAQGRRSGLAAALGLSLGALVHVAAAAIGLSAILVASSTAFSIVKALGAGYLILLGVRALLGRNGTSGPVPLPEVALGRAVREGIVISIFNPKIAIFFLAFLPQFADPAAGPLERQILFLGLLYVALALLSDGAYAALAGTLHPWLRRRVRGPWPRLLTGGLYIGLGINTALAGRRS